MIEHTYIPSSRRAEKLMTHALSWFPDTGAPFSVLVASGEMDDYEAAGVPHLIDVGPRQPQPGVGKAHSMNCAMAQHLSGTWLAFMDDDVKGLHAPPDEWYFTEDGAWIQAMDSRKLARLLTTDRAADYEELMNGTTVQADAWGVPLCGFAPTGNPFFVNAKWRTLGYLLGTLTLHKVGGLPPILRHMEDWFHTLECILRYGSVCRNDFIHPVAGKFVAKGGHGTYPERGAYRDQDIRAALAIYPGIVGTREWQGIPDLKMASYSHKIIDAARHEIMHTRRTLARGFGRTL